MRMGAIGIVGLFFAGVLVMLELEIPTYPSAGTGIPI